MHNHLHIVCLDVPWPADYGGAIDMMNRIKALHTNGINIHLHYFNYNERGNPKELHNYCNTVQGYDRKKITECLQLSQPYIVSSRASRELAEQLNKDDYPVLLEGLHCAGIIEQLHNKNRPICIRMHNNEAVYYNELSQASSGIFRKIYYKAESQLIKKFAASLPRDIIVACISAADVAFFKEQGFHRSFLLPAFPSWQKVTGKEGMGCHCIFHGKLSVPENEKAALWLLNKVFTKVRVPLIIAGKNPSRQLQHAASLCQHTCLVSDPCESDLNDLVQKAHINVLPCFNKNITGIRLKLLHSLFSGRHCVTTPAMVSGTGLESACHTGTNSNAFASIISQLYYRPFEEDEIRLREYLLKDTYNNDKNADLLIEQLYC